MPRYRVTVTEVVTQSGTIEVEARSEEEAEELVAAEGGYSPEDLTRSTADVFFDVESLEE
jgi:phosphoribosyl-ATP pyrophosphohydrolase